MKSISYFSQNLAFGAATAQFFRQNEFVAISLHSRRASHQNFSRRRCKHSDAAGFLRRVAGACDAENARIQRSDMRKTLPKFASMTHEFVANFSPFRRAANQNLQSFLRLFRFVNCETSAAPMQVGAVLRAEKIVRSAPRLRIFSARKCANSLQILCTADAHRTKTSAGVAAKTFGCCRLSASSCWRVRCWKRAHPAIWTCAKLCQNLHR